MFVWKSIQCHTSVLVYEKYHAIKEFIKSGFHNLMNKHNNNSCDLPRIVSRLPINTKRLVLILVLLMRSLFIKRTKWNFLYSHLKSFAVKIALKTLLFLTLLMIILMCFRNNFIAFVRLFFFTLCTITRITKLLHLNSVASLYRKALHMFSSHSRSLKTNCFKTILARDPWKLWFTFFPPNYHVIFELQ
ncbi:CLUMA_CG002942, isoform A [Clunio marinus]|uniref:CLUMA_CG002942, isoform A n=1 Tax=Clunio marinus TaxID=568069 RepID=A0A1J1HMB3_9DIPT|nr:CLUMA_CG002942, isoform A [Clunio marinus]